MKGTMSSLFSMAMVCLNILLTMGTLVKFVVLNSDPNSTAKVVALYIPWSVSAG